ncbi:hypothetical protein OUZ56_021878 [Daphnia magna]|uniref:Uncharacterized protein n=1 Tax=Daphnia magna TaxID=35525 RepID=A0ABR0AUX5_9CRUS|nr:hypothetical protein OUZ56_021878 [Daphnia magna]
MSDQFYGISFFQKSPSYQRRITTHGSRGQLCSINSFIPAQAVTNSGVVIVTTVIPYGTMEAFDVIRGETSCENELKSTMISGISS